MSFEETLEQTIAILRRNKRVSYRALRRQFDVDDAYVEDLKAELIEVLKLAADEDGKVLVWTGAEPDLAVAAKVAAELVDTIASVGQKEAGRVVAETAPAAAPLAPGQAPARLAAGERRHLTVLFCDLVDSTPLAERLDPEELAEVYGVWHQACTEEIARHGGHIADYRGDGVFVYFGYPTAYEDGPHRGLRAALGMLDRLHAVNVTIEARYRTTLAVRMGIHTGLVLLSDLGGRFIRDQFALGEVPNIAARLQALAEPNQIIVSGAVRSLVRGYFTVEDLGEHSLKGVSRPVAVCRVIGQTAAVDRMQASEAKGRTALVARQSEIAALQLRWTLSTQGHGQAVLLIGEAGIGKSRVVEVVNGMAEAAGAQRVIFRCSPYHSASALHPFVDNIVRGLGIDPDRPGPESHAKLQQSLANSGSPDPARDAELIATVLALPQREMPLTQGLTPHQRRTQALDAMVAWMMRAANRRPVLFAIEDIHWADPSTLEFLGLVLDAIGDLRVNVLMTSRPEYQLPFPVRPNLTRITLARLTDAEAERLVENAFRGKSIPAELRRQIVGRADGVPLFVEELVAMILEAGMLREENGGYVPIQPLATLPIPLTLQDSLAARLDRLAEARDTAQLAAALGREFSFELISAVSPLEIATLLSKLKMLVESELIQQHGEAPNATYRFKHALIQDAAYQSMLRTRRRQYHEMIGKTLEQRFPGVVEMQPEIVAHHFTEAGLAAPATRYWRWAGEQALRRSANVEALLHLDRGIALLSSGEATPGQSLEELPLQLARGAALMMVKGQFAPEVEACFARARALSQDLEDTPDLFTVLFGLWRSQLARGALTAARDIAEQLMGIAERLDDPALRLGAHSALSLVLYHLCEFPDSRAHAEAGVVLFESASLRMQGSAIMNMGQHPALACYLCLSFIHLLTGTPDQALARQRQALRLAQETGVPFQIATATGWSIMLASLRRDDEAALENADKVLALAEQHMFSQWDLVGRFYRGIHLVGKGAHEEGLALARGMIEVADRLGYGTIRMRFRALMAQACGATGHREEGLALLREAIALADHSGERWWEAEMYRIEGELVLQDGGDNAAAEACFRRALERARAQGLRLFELRAATNLARLYAGQGRAGEARGVLAPVLAAFTEGFGTRDLLDARAVLDRIPA